MRLSSYVSKKTNALIVGLPHRHGDDIEQYKKYKQAIEKGVPIIPFDKLAMLFGAGIRNELERIRGTITFSNLGGTYFKFAEYDGLAQFLLVHPILMKPLVDFDCHNLLFKTESNDQ
jgi:hypothetical protein